MQVYLLELFVIYVLKVKFFQFIKGYLNHTQLFSKIAAKLAIYD